MKPPAPPATDRVCLDGRLVPAARARISIFDRGFQYGDGVIETMRLVDGRCIAWEAHLARLTRSAEALGIPLPSGASAAAVARVVAANDLRHGEGWARLTLTRGTSQRGILPPAHVCPTWLLAAGRLDPSLGTARKRGVAVVTLDFGRPEVLGEHKHAFYLPAVLGKRVAAERGAFDGLMVAPGGWLQGGTSSNLIVRLGDEWITPTGAGVLPGVTRARVEQLLRAEGIRLRHRRLGRRQLVHVSDAFLTNALFELVPIVRLDGRRLPIDPLVRRLQRQLLAGDD